MLAIPLHREGHVPASRAGRVERVRQLLAGSVSRRGIARAAAIHDAGKPGRQIGPRVREGLSDRPAAGRREPQP